MKFSVIIPAHNEEKFIEKCFSSISTARANSTYPVEVIVCLNRCTDKTEELVKNFGATLVYEDAKNLSKIRNTAAAAATGDIIVTLDADSQMSANMFSEIDRALSSGRFIGGGTKIKLERLSFGIIMSSLVILPYAWAKKIPSAGLFWCLRKDFEAIGGFDVSKLTAEDLDFAHRLKAHGSLSKRSFGTLWKAHIITSCRKFDQFGDWYFFKNPKVVKSLFSGSDLKAANKFYYENKK